MLRREEKLSLRWMHCSIQNMYSVDGDCGWKYEVFKEQIEAHPSTPLDGSSDILSLCNEVEGAVRGEPRG
jgi:hypothetical protein